MKNVVILLFALVLITSCGGQKKQEEKEVRNVQLKGEEMPVDTALFRYAYRISSGFAPKMQEENPLTLPGRPAGRSGHRCRCGYHRRSKASAAGCRMPG